VKTRVPKHIPNPKMKKGSRSYLKESIVFESQTFWMMSARKTKMREVLMKSKMNWRGKRDFK
jgi:hypothetical protein